MSLNLARHHHRAQHQPPAPERILPPEAKGVKLRPMSIDDLAAVHDLGEKIYDQHLYPNLYRIWFVFWKGGENRMGGHIDRELAILLLRK